LKVCVLNFHIAKPQGSKLLFTKKYIIFKNIMRRNVLINRFCVSCISVTVIPIVNTIPIVVQIKINEHIFNLIVSVTMRACTLRSLSRGCLLLEFTRKKCGIHQMGENQLTKTLLIIDFKLYFIDCNQF